MSKVSLPIAFLICLSAIMITACKTDPETPYTGEKAPIVRRYALELDVRVAFIKPLRDKNDDPYRYEAELEVLAIMRGDHKLKVGDKLTVDVDVPAMKYYKLKPEEKFRVRLKLPLIQEKRYRLVPGSIVSKRTIAAK